MFCTACATRNVETLPRCTVCGAPLRRQAPGDALPGRRRHGASIRALLQIVPIAAVLIGGGYVLNAYRGERQALAAAYDRAEAALAGGDYDAAVAAFTEAGQFRDAEVRREQTLADVAPYRAHYLRGLDALNAGQYDAAITALVLVVRDLPDYEDAALLLQEARRLQSASLMTELADAESHRRWLDAERILLRLLADDPENLVLRERLFLIQQSHAPLVFSRNGAVYVSGPDLLDEALVTDEVSAVWPIWSPDRTRIAFYASTDSATGRYGLYVVNLDGTGLKLLADHVRLEGWPIWSPDGTRIAFTSLEDFMFEGNHGISSIRVAEVATGKVTDLTSDRFHYVTSPTWSPDSSRIAFISKRVYSRGAAVGRRVEGSLHVIDVGTRATTEIAPKQLPHVDYVTWSPIDDVLLLLSTELGSGWYDMQFTTIQLVDVRTGLVDDLTNRSQAVSYPFWSPDGSRFAFTEGNNIIHVRGIDGAVTMINAPRDAAPFISWSPDGNLLMVPANSTGMASMILPVAGGGAPADLSLTYDYSAELAGPPQWAPRTTQEAAPTGLISGTALDR